MAEQSSSVSKATRHETDLQLAPALIDELIVMQLEQALATTIVN